MLSESGWISNFTPDLAVHPFFIKKYCIFTFVSSKIKIFQDAFKTKTFASFTAFLCMTFTNVSAQTKKLNRLLPNSVQRCMTEWMTSKLALNTKQVEQVSALNLQYAQKNDPIIQSNEGKLSKFKKLKALQKEKSNALSQILDAGQYKKYEEIKDQMVQNIKDKRK
jgi:hypothetical protein